MKGKDKGKSREGPPAIDDIPRRIRLRRRALGLTGTELAEKAGVSPSWISLIENGEKVPTEDTAARIAEALGENVDEFRIWAGKARLGGRTATWINELEGWHQSWLGRLFRPAPPARPAHAEDAAAPSSPLELAMAFEDSSRDLESAALLRDEMPERSAKRSPTPAQARKPPTLQAWTPADADPQLGYRRGSPSPVIAMAPRIDPDYPLDPDAEISPRAIIGRVPVDLRTVLDTSGRLVALELNESNAAFVVPRLAPGDLALIDLDDRDPGTTPSSDLLFLVRTPHGSVFSRCTRKDRFLILTPEDPSCVPEILEPPADPSSPSPILGRVIWTARRYARS